MPNGYDIGTEVRTYAEFTSRESGALVDPSTVQLTVTKPNAVVTTYTYGVGAVIAKDSTGNYHADITPDQTGKWTRRWIGSGTVIAQDEAYFLAR